jgi:hypothetical protein
LLALLCCGFWPRIAVPIALQIGVAAEQCNRGKMKMSPTAGWSLDPISITEREARPVD